MRILSLILSLFMLVATAVPVAAAQDCAMPGEECCETLQQSEHSPEPGQKTDHTAQEVVSHLHDGQNLDCVNMAGCVMHASAILMNRLSEVHFQPNQESLFLTRSPQSPHVFPSIEPPIL